LPVEVLSFLHEKNDTATNIKRTSKVDFVFIFNINQLQVSVNSEQINYEHIYAIRVNLNIVALT